VADGGAAHTQDDTENRARLLLGRRRARYREQQRKAHERARTRHHGTRAGSACVTDRTSTAPVVIAFVEDGYLRGAHKAPSHSKSVTVPSSSLTNSIIHPYCGLKKKVSDCAENGTLPSAPSLTSTTSCPLSSVTTMVGATPGGKSGNPA